MDDYNLDEDFEELDLGEINDEEDEVEDDDVDEEDDEEEEDVEEEEEEEEIDVEEVEEIEEKEIELDVDDGVDSDAVTFSDMYGSDEGYVSKKQRRVKIQRYCKSSKDIVRRKKQVFHPTPFLTQHMLSDLTTQHNAIRFAETNFFKDDLYQLCGKLIHKEFPFSELYKEVKTLSDVWLSKTYQKESEKEAQEIQVMTVKLTVTEGLYECSRCKSKKTYSRQVQTRSADEGMTSIIQCSECNKVWKEYS